jgi:hypothetical protein
MQQQTSIEFPPITGQHVVVHAAAAVHQDEDLGAATYARKLGLWFSKTAQSYDNTEHRHGGEYSPQPTGNLTERISR